MLKTTFTVFALFITTFSFAQLTLEHSYEIGAIVYNDETFSFQTENKIYHYTYDIDNILNIYNEDHSLYKKVELPIETSYEIVYIEVFTDKLFNSDNLIEFFVRSRNSNGQNKLQLFNENSELLYDFGNKDDVSIIQDKNKNFKLIITHDAYYEKNREYTYKDVYSIEGGTLSQEQYEQLKQKIIAYPNPANSVINITNTLDNKTSGTLRIFSVTGALVLEEDVTNSNDEFVKVDISKLSKGVYISKLNGVSKRFVKE